MKFIIFKCATFFSLLLIALALNQSLTSGTDWQPSSNFRRMDYRLYFKYPMHLLRAIPNPKPYYNLLISPPSVRYILMMLSYAATGQTKSEIKRLQYGYVKSSLNYDLRSLHDNFKMHFKLYINKHMNITPCFYDLFRPYAQAIDYYNKEGSSDEINNWLKSVTNQAVPQIVLPKFHNGSSTFLTFVLAYYFETTWKKPFVNIFDKDPITGQKFLAPMMHQDNIFKYGYLEEFKAIAVELPLNNNATMIVLQPKDFQENFNELKRKLLKYDFRQIPSRLKPTEIGLYFPKLNAIKMDRSLVDTMKNLLIELPFTKNADFRNLHICIEDIFINMFNQRSRIYATLEGVRIGSATGIQFENSESLSELLGDEEENEDEDYEPTLFTTNVIVPPNPNLPKVDLTRPFFYGLIRANVPMWLGTIYKPNNLDIDPHLDITPFL